MKDHIPSTAVNGSVSLAELQKMIRDTGAQNNAGYMDMFELLQCDYNEDLAMALRESLLPAYQKIQLKPDYFAPMSPGRDEVSGMHEAGKVSHTGASYGLSPKEIHHLYLPGSTGYGKTVTTVGFLTTFIASMFACLVISFKREYRGLIGLFKDRVLIFRLSDSLFKINPLCPPPGVPILYWLNLFADVFSQAAGLLTASKSFIMQVVSELYLRYGIYDDQPEKEKIYPSLFDLLDYLKTQSYAKYSRDARYYEATCNRLVGFLLSTGDLCNCSRGINFTDILDSGKSIVLEVDGLSVDWTQCLCNLILFHIFAYKLNRKGQKMNNEPRYIIVLEDAQPIFDIDLERRVYEGMPQIAVLFEKGREEGLSLIVSDQVPSQTIHALRANCNQVICYHLADGKDIKEMQISFGLSDEEAKVISQLKRGEAIVKKQAIRIRLRCRCTTSNCHL